LNTQGEKIETTKFRAFVLNISSLPSVKSAIYEIKLFVSHIAKFGKLLHCLVLIRARLFARGRFNYYWMKRCFIQYKCCIDTRFSKCSSQEFAGFTVCEKFPSLSYYWSLSIFIYIHRSILRSCDRKFVFHFWCRSRRCHRYKETFKSQIFVSGDLEIFPKKSSPRQIIFISITAFKRYVAHFLKCCP